MEDEQMTATLKAYKGMGMEGSTARWYDRTTRKDMPEFKTLAQRIASALPPTAQVLEVAPLSNSHGETPRRKVWMRASNWGTPPLCRWKMQA
jgi:hypothetical protein